MKKFLTILILSTLILCACNFEQDVENKHDRNASTKTTGNEQKKKEVINGRTYYDGILIVNKTTKLPSDYNPVRNLKHNVHYNECLLMQKRWCESL